MLAVTQSNKLCDHFGQGVLGEPLKLLALDRPVLVYCRRLMSGNSMPLYMAEILRQI